VQFLGRIRQPFLEKVWRIKAEGKVQMFLWLLLQNRKWTAERLRARGLQHDDRCCLCDQEFETAKHLVLHCPFAKEVWNHFMGSNPLAVQRAGSSTSLRGWWNKVTRQMKDDQKKKDNTLSSYVVWHIWKERGRRIFQHESLTPSVVAGLIRVDLENLVLAKG
jgi:hypothetical protein